MSETRVSTADGNIIFRRDGTALSAPLAVVQEAVRRASPLAFYEPIEVRCLKLTNGAFHKARITRKAATKEEVVQLMTTLGDVFVLNVSDVVEAHLLNLGGPDTLTGEFQREPAR